jgi:hypothetical protein
MGGTGGKNQVPNKHDGKTRKPPSTAEDDDVEDGDIATPKKDSTGEDDQPL